VKSKEANESIAIEFIAGEGIAAGMSTELEKKGEGGWRLSSEGGLQLMYVQTMLRIWIRQ
jgi:hypothetical protein